MASNLFENYNLNTSSYYKLSATLNLPQSSYYVRIADMQICEHRSAYKMSNSNLLSSMPFLPATAPQDPVVDCAGVLSSARLSDLNVQARQAYFKPKIVILPANFAPASMMDVSSRIAQQWHMSSDELLMVINLGGHNLRIMPGQRLKSEGITDSKVAELIRTKFGPSMRKVHSADDLVAALPSAISNTIDGVNQTLGHGKGITAHSLAQASSSTAHTISNAAQRAPSLFPQSCNLHSGMNVWVPIAVAAVIVLSIAYLQRRQHSK